IAGASVTGAAGGGTVWTITVNTGAGSGTIRLDVPNTATINDGVGNALSGLPFTGGQIYTVDKTAPTVTIDQAVGQADPTSLSPINFTVTFSEPVVGFTSADVVIGGTAGATTANVSGGPAVYTVAVSGMTVTGTVTATIPAGAANDAAGNLSAASTSTDNSVNYLAIIDRHWI